MEPPARIAVGILAKTRKGNVIRYWTIPRGVTRSGPVEATGTDTNSCQMWRAAEQRGALARDWGMAVGAAFAP